MKPIEPGCLAVTINCAVPENNGRVVTVIRFIGHDTLYAPLQAPYGKQTRRFRFAWEELASSLWDTNSSASTATKKPKK